MIQRIELDDPQPSKTYVHHLNLFSFCSFLNRCVSWIEKIPSSERDEEKEACTCSLYRKAKILSQS